MNTIKEIYEEMKRVHSLFCDYPCFTERDVEILLVSIITEKPFVIKDEGTTIRTLAGDFGNLSYSHFVDCFNAVVHKT
ncbi:MAG: hypothetical protein QXJ72_05565 [Thermoproteota archaeon]